jgi:hypothetical protein
LRTTGVRHTVKLDGERGCEAFPEEFMRHWKSILYRASLIRRGEIEPVTVEVIVLYTLLFACFVTTVGILVWTVGPALAARWTGLSRALSGV